MSYGDPDQLDRHEKAVAARQRRRDALIDAVAALDVDALLELVGPRTATATIASAIEQTQHDPVDVTAALDAWITAHPGHRWEHRTETSTVLRLIRTAADQPAFIPIT